MEIILMRHGKPDVSGTQKVAASAMPSWIEQYDLSDISEGTPPESCVTMASQASVLISSRLPRALSSAVRLGVAPQISADIFREAELPHYNIPFLKLSPFHWAILFRLMWLCGLSRDVEPYSVAKKRAIQAANLLIGYAKEHDGPVLLAGHGIMNRLIAKALISAGWTACSRAGRGYWGTDVLEFPER